MTHKVWLVETTNGAFSEREVPCPVPKAKQVLISISASGVNPLEPHTRNSHFRRFLA
jgi:NADPH:quinone reductase-like Zn-dependent oxidoreductase